MAYPHSSDLEDAITQAHDELGDSEFDLELHHAEEAGEQAARRAFWLWLLCLITVAVAVAVTVSNPFFAVVIPLLLLLFTLPIVAAGQVTAAREVEREVLKDAVLDHRRRTGRVTGPPAVGTPARPDEGPPEPREA